MTKQEWLNYIEEDEKYPKRAIILDIYDDFESRICENCEEFKISKGFSGVEFTCYKGYGCTNEYGNIFTERDFGCSEFKRKLNDN